MNDQAIILSVVAILVTGLVIGFILGLFGKDSGK